jgi:acetoin:2,6-dichlorophenolindophenol oxidoreductase subunit alpha
MRTESHTKEFLAGLYRTLYTIRVFETRCVQLYRQGLIRGYFHPYLGEEAIATGVCAALEEGDYIASTHRGHGHCIARGGRIDRMAAELLGKSTGYCKGLGGSMHIADVAAGNLGANGIVGAGIPIGVGAALTCSLRETDRVAVTFTSDGAANNGVFGESLNLAAIWNLPFILVIENNQYAVSTPIESVSRDPDLYRRGLAYGIQSLQVDGNDVLEVYTRTADAVALCRKGQGPVLLEAKTYRQTGHHVNDPGTYMPRERLEHYKAKDPVALGRRYLAEAGTEEAEIRAVEEAVESALERAVDFARESPVLSPREFEEIVEGY